MSPRTALAGLVAALLALPTLVVPALASGPLTGFSGRWKGGGVVTTADGARESLRCRATYSASPSGDALDVDVNCASDSYRVNLVGSLVDRDGALSGSWQETTRQVGGEVTGEVPRPNTLRASLQALGGGLEIGARTDGRRQTINIVVQGSDIRGVDITLKRR